MLSALDALPVPVAHVHLPERSGAIGDHNRIMVSRRGRDVQTHTTPKVPLTRPEHLRQFRHHSLRKSVANDKAADPQHFAASPFCEMDRRGRLAEEMMFAA